MPERTKQLRLLIRGDRGGRPRASAPLEVVEPPAEDRARPFTEYIRSLDPGGAPPDEQSFLRVMEALRGVLVGELKRRGLWESPPSYLGVYGVERWAAGGGVPSAHGREEDPLDELAAACYTFIFVERFEALSNQLRVKPNIDGLVVLNVRHFVYERQRAHDPLGFRVFKAVQRVVREMVEAGELVVLGGDPKVRNDTVLGFEAEADPVDPEEVDLAAMVREWNNELLPDLVTAQGRGRQPVLGSLRQRLRELEGRGIDAIRLRDLIDPLKNDVRARWASLLEGGGTEVATGVEQQAWARASGCFQPGVRFEEQETFEALVDCVFELVARSREPEATRRYLVTLWQFLRSYAGEEGHCGALPSQRRLASLLSIPRDRLPGLFDTLAELAERCQAAIAGHGAVIWRQGLSGGGQRSPEAGTERRGE